MKIRLIRHGKTEANEKRLYCGATDLPLSEQGIVELQQMKTRADLSFACLYITSGLKRAIQTIEILYGRTPDIIMRDFDEMNFGEFEMKSYDNLKNEPDYIRWITKNENVCCPGGESRKIFAERVARGLGEMLLFDTEHIVAVFHGGVIAAIMEKLFPGQKNFYEWQPGFGKGYTLEFNKGKVISWTN